MGTKRLSKDSVSGAATSELMDEVHDRWFNLTDVRFDPTAGDFVLLYGGRKGGPFDHKLRITGVASIQVHDEARIGLYDVNEIRIEPSADRITLVSGFPLKIELVLKQGWEIFWGEGC